MARPKRFELLTPRFVVWCSIQLSYGRVLRIAREVFPENPESQGTASSYRLRPMLARFGVHVPLSPAGLTRGSILLRKTSKKHFSQRDGKETFFATGWIAGSSPAMTVHVLPQ